MRYVYVICYFSKEVTYSNISCTKYIQFQCTFKVGHSHDKNRFDTSKCLIKLKDKLHVVEDHTRRKQRRAMDKR